MTAHCPLVRISTACENHVAIAARVDPEWSQAPSVSIVDAVRTYGRAAASALTNSLRSFTRSSRAFAGQALDMGALLPEAVTRIYPRSPLVLAASAGQAITCDEGTVWITQGDREDYVLIAGQYLALAPTDQVIVSAMFAPAVVRRLGARRENEVPA
jgi:hypothetical protein